MEKTILNPVFENVESFEIEPPRPLRKPLSPPKPYPTNCLGSVLENAALAIHDKLQSPIEICAQSVLAAAALAVQGHANVELPYGQTRPLSGFFVSIADSGERKSSTDSEALKPFKDKEEWLREQCDCDLKQWKIKKTSWDAEKAKILQDQKKNKTVSRDEIEAKLSFLGEEPSPPLEPLLTCPEPTYEGICRYLMTGQPSIGVFSDEGGQFVGGYGMSADNRTKTAAAFCGLWDGNDIKRVRAGDGTVILAGRRVSVHLMMQSSIANELLSDNGLLDQGLLSRFLFTAPESTIGTRFYKEPKAASNIAIQTYRERLSLILNQSLPIKENTKNELQPRLIAFDEDSKKIWFGFVNEVEKKMANDQEWSQIRGFANKLPEHAARIAAILALIDDIRTEVIGAHYIRPALLLAAYYASEAVRLQENGYVSADILIAEKLLDWLHTSWDLNVVSLPDIYQRSLNKINDAKTASKIVTILEEHGYLSKVDGGGVIKGTKRNDVWRIVNKTLDVLGTLDAKGEIK